MISCSSIRSRTCGLIAFLLLIVCVLGYLIDFHNKKIKQETSDFLKEQIPFTPNNFFKIFHSELIRKSNVGRGFQHCSFVQGDNNPTLEEPRLNDIGTLKVTRSLPATRVQVYDDRDESKICYHIHANNLRSSLICYEYDQTMNFLWEISSVCKIYTQPIDWGGSYF